MSHSARITMPWPAKAQLTAISPSLVLRLPRNFTLSVRRAEVPDAVGFVALASA